MSSVMPQNFENLIRKINSAEDEKIACVIADATTAWALEVAEKMEIKRAMFWPTSVRGFVLGFHILKLVEAGIIDYCGKSKIVLVFKYKRTNHGLFLLVIQYSESSLLMESK